MIDFIDGEIVYAHPDAIVIKVGGIGYRVFCPNPYAVGNEGERIRLFTYQYVREDLISLYGFPTREERELFSKLLEVSRVGPKGAMAIIASDSPKKVVRAIYDEDLRYLTSLPGIGKKTAQRIILDLKDKLEIDVWLNEVIDSDHALEHDQPEMIREGPADEAIEALLHLGYNEKEAKQAVTRAIDSSGQTEMSVDELIKKALQTFLS